MASARGGVGAKDEIPEVEMEIVETRSEEPARVGSKRVRDSPNGNGSHGLCGVTAEKKARTHVERTLPDSNALRSSITSPGETLGNKINRPTRICNFYTQGQCKKGNSCTFLHEREGPGSDHRWNNEEKAGLLAPGVYGNTRGSEGGSQVHCLSNLKVPQFKGSEGSTKGLSQGISSRIDDSLMTKLTTPINKLVQSPVIYEKNHQAVMGLHRSAETYLSGRGTSPRLLDGGILQTAGDRGNNLSLTGFRNPGYATSDHSFGGPTLRVASHLGILSHHVSSPGIEKAGLQKYAGVGTGTSRPSLLASSSSQPSTVSPGFLSPIKDEVWETSVPFVPSFDFPVITTPPRTVYDPFVDYMDSPKVDKTNDLKPSNISCSISSQHTNQCVTTTKSLNRDEKLVRNMSAKGSNELAYLIASERVRSSSLDDNNRMKVCDRKTDAANNNEKAREFRFRLAEHIKELIKPIWKEGFLSKDAHKLVVKKSVDKVLSSVEPHQVPTSEESITNYITVSESKIERLVKAYVDRHRTA